MIYRSHYGLDIASEPWPTTLMIPYRLYQLVLCYRCALGACVAVHPSCDRDAAIPLWVVRSRINEDEGITPTRTGLRVLVNHHRQSAPGEVHLQRTAAGTCWLSVPTPRALVAPVLAGRRETASGCDRRRRAMRLRQTLPRLLSWSDKAWALAFETIDRFGRKCYCSIHVAHGTMTEAHAYSVTLSSL